MGTCQTNKKKYLLTLRFPFEAIDHLDARLTARLLLKELGSRAETGDGKLQMVNNGKPPEKVVL